MDRWLWTVRLAKTRSEAAAACRGGHVKVNDRTAKPATPVKPGDEVRARVHNVTRIVDVLRIIPRRTSAAEAATCYRDRTPPPPPKEERIPVAKRERGSGRPTKKERRQLDAFRARAARQGIPFP